MNSIDISVGYFL